MWSRAVLGRETLTWGGGTVSLESPWTRLDVDEAFSRYAGVSAAAALESGDFDELMGIRIEPNLGFDRPVFLKDYPAACAALARKKANAPHLAERFELYICGLELCNAFSELIDPAEQRSRFCGGKPPAASARPAAHAAARALSGRPGPHARGHGQRPGHRSPGHCF